MNILYLFDFIEFFYVGVTCAHDAISNDSVPIKGKRIFIACFYQQAKSTPSQHPP